MSSKDHDQRFAEVILEAFEAVDLATDSDVGAAGGPSTSWMTELRRVRDGKQDSFKARPRPDTLRKIDTAARWRPGTARKLLKTGEYPYENATVIVGPPIDTSFSQWLTRSESELTDEEQEELWAKAEAVLEALKAQVLNSRERGSHLGDT